MADVLVADDEPDLLVLVEMHLAPSGHRVTTVGSAEDVLDRLRSGLPDVLLLDLRMPGMGGRELLRVLAEEGTLARLPVVVVSAHASDDMVQEVLALGCRAYVRKPFSGEEVRSVVDAVLQEV